jgi:hypothetical protein
LTYQQEEAAALLQQVMKAISSKGSITAYVNAIYSVDADEEIRDESYGVLRQLIYELSQDTTPHFHELMARLTAGGSGSSSGGGGGGGGGIGAGSGSGGGGGVVPRDEFTSLFALWLEKKIEFELRERLG